MNRSRGRVSYRRRTYRKNRIKLILGVVAIVLATVFIALVIAGNMIGDKVDNNIVKRNPKKDQTDALPHGEVKNVLAYPVPIYVEGSSLLATRIKNASDEGYTDACFFLDDLNGALCYNSKVAIALGKHESKTDMPSLEKATSAFKDKDMYSIGMTHLSEFRSDDDLARSAAMGYYSSLLGEALRAGVNDVMIFVGEIPTERYAELCELAKDVHRLCPDGKIGLALPVTLLSDQSNAELLDGLWDCFDYLAADLTHLEATEVQSLADVTDATLGGMLYYLLRYDMRVLISYANDTELTQVIEAVKRNGTENIQIIQQ